MSKGFLVCLLAVAISGAAGAQTASSTPAATRTAEHETPAAERLIATAESPQLEDLLNEVLERNPDLASLRAAARASAQREPQVRSLPDPMAGATAFLWAPETRVGPQQGMISLTQKFPWFGKLELKGRVALAETAAAQAAVEAKRLDLITETRRLYYELGFLDTYESVVKQDRDTLSHYEELARARYAAGVGVEQAVVKIQAEITRDSARLLDIESRRTTLVATLNALRNRPQSEPLGVTPLPAAARPALNLPEIEQSAHENRPEVAGADAMIERARLMNELAKKQFRPDIVLGLSYTAVGDRTDPAGRLNPPPHNGHDILGISAGINIPLWRHRLEAGVYESESRQTEAAEHRQAVVTNIDRSLGDLVSRLPLIAQRLDLFRKVLNVQAREALRSAEAGYAAGTLKALDLLDAERVLLQVRTATARAQADYDIAIAQLEGAVGAPISPAAAAQGDSK
ncbi:MAG TPA: TolC family protein [Thermoanaerobaculia bacterium]|nr:TolC family protein [Thermoanaerobaculia bacterium]